jgi:hypothetical protein
MHLVVIYGWQEEENGLAQVIASALGITVFEARQRMIGGGPAVLASYADPQRAQDLAAALGQGGASTLVVDAGQLRSGGCHLTARRFELGERSLKVEAVDGNLIEIAYVEIDLLLSGIRISGQTESKTITERKMSLGRTLLSGGIPLSKTVTRQEEVTSEERTRCLYLFAGGRPPLVFRQSGLAYDGLGAAMKMSQELNFNHLVSELRRLGVNARYDERLANRQGQVRILGPAQHAEGGVDLAAEILGRSLLR